MFSLSATKPPEQEQDMYTTKQEWDEVDMLDGIAGLPSDKRCFEIDQATFELRWASHKNETAKWYRSNAMWLRKYLVHNPPNIPQYGQEGHDFILDDEDI